MDYIERIAERIREMQKIADELGSKIPREKASPVALSGKFCGVDGGLAVIRLHGFDVCLHRAIGVVFEYKADKLVSVDYFPDAYISPDIETFEYDQDSSNKLASLARMLGEIETGLSLSKKCDLVFMDGSLFPQPQDKIESELYYKVVENAERLIRSGNVVGIVEDSRGKRISSMYGVNAIDTVLLGRIMKPGEFTVPVEYSDNPRNHFILRDFSEDTVKSVKVFYIKTSPFDVALRVEFPDTLDYKDLADIVYSLSRGSGFYGYPSILLEADARAKIKEIEVNNVLEDLSRFVGDPEIMRLRRNRRLRI